MKIQIEVADKLIDEALEDVHAKYWAYDLVWNTATRKGWAGETYGDNDKKQSHTINETKIRAAIQKMLTEGRPEIADVLRGETDGPCRDVFLQYIVFGELKYE